MASLNWSSLRKLVLVGRSPLNETPLIVLLENLPDLRVLDVQISYVPPFLVWPPAVGSRSISNGEAVLPMLEQLSLTNADPTDLILQYIPSNVKTLSLVPYPRTFVTRYDGVLKAALSRTIAMEGRYIIAILTNNDVSLLTVLRISVYGTLHVDLFRTIATRCPRLETLEVFRRRSASKEQVNESCSDIGSALFPLSRLRTLRIAFDFTDGPDKITRSISHSQFYFQPFWDSCLHRAREIAMHAGPSLEQLAFSKRRAEKGFWFSYDIKRPSEGQLVVVERDDDWEYTL